MRRVLLRVFLYVYVTAGVVGMLVGFVVAPMVMVLAFVLVAANWENLSLPMSARRWIPLFIIATLGIARVILLGAAAGSGTLS
jgi:hypothetical protein